MLVLTQKEGEILQIGDDIRIHIKRVKGNWVRLCIDAPREVRLLRIPVDKAAAVQADRPRQPTKSTPDEDPEPAG